MARKTIKQLEKALADAKAETENYLHQAVDQRTRAAAADKALKEAREHFSDLKVRLSNSEMENQRLRGYLARVQEDDTVREELLTVGAPDGEQRMVPKRKSTVFERPNDCADQRSFSERLYRGDDEGRKPRHWITY